MATVDYGRLHVFWAWLHVHEEVGIEQRHFHRIGLQKATAASKVLGVTGHGLYYFTHPCF